MTKALSCTLVAHRGTLPERALHAPFSFTIRRVWHVRGIGATPAEDSSHALHHEHGPDPRRSDARGACRSRRESVCDGAKGSDAGTRAGGDASGRRAIGKQAASHPEGRGTSPSGWLTARS